MVALAGAAVVGFALNAAAQGDLPHLSVQGIDLYAKPPPQDAKYDVPIVEPQRGLENLRQAVDLLMRHSPMNARAIETLKQHGRVIIVYDPQHPPPQATVDGIAAFFPNFFRPEANGGEGDFLVVVGRHGIKWPANELAAVIGHELAGHGMQRLRGERESMRMLDRECEADLYQEKALQDLGVNKSSPFVVRFRKNMENRSCSDFRTFQRRNRPETLKLWEARNPDVVALLAVFREYLRDLRAHGRAAALNAGPTEAERR